MSEEQKRILEQKLWDIANILRGKISANQFQDYILGFIFYKYLSEKMERYADHILKPDKIKYIDIKERSKEGREYLSHIKEASVEHLGFFLKPSELFRSLALKDKNHKTVNEAGESVQAFILEDLAAVLKNIERSTMGADSHEDFDQLFYDIDLNSTKIGRTEKDRNEVITRILVSLNQIDFDLDNANSDVLGDAYEYLISQFAAGAGQKAGEFYTPAPVSTVLARIVTSRKKKIKSVYDPTCGSGSLLLRVAKEAKVSYFYGQEQNRTTYNLARMNMILHNVPYQQFNIVHEDTLERPGHPDMLFEAIVANPPFSAHWKADALKMNDERFASYGKLAPATVADYAFIQHMIHHLDDNGIMACIAPHGVLFRSGAEGYIRRFLIEERNYIDAVIGLPVNLFYGTSIPACILVLKKCKEHPNDILFIDASRHFEKVKNKNVLRPEDINAIVDAYNSRRPVTKYAAVATLDEVKAKDFNLNIPRYVDTFEADESINLNKTVAELVELRTQMNVTQRIIATFCKELGIKPPF
jgi:type I restriction enzyme M protein